MFIQIFSPYEHGLATLLQKYRNNLPPYFFISATIMESFWRFAKAFWVEPVKSPCHAFH